MNEARVRGRHAQRWVLAQIPLLAMTLALPVAQVLLQVQGQWIGLLGLPARGLGLLLTGFAIMVFRAAKRELGSDLVATPMPAPEATLRVTGIYGTVRHPIYLAIVSGVIGWALLWNSAVSLGLAVACAAFFLAKSRYEERLLTQTFPGYEEYRRSVPGFVPHGRIVIP